jgi:hypothetical protein
MTTPDDGEGRGVTVSDHFVRGGLTPCLTDMSRGRSWVLAPFSDPVSVSQYFQVNDLVLWNPSNRVAELFVRTSEAICPLVATPTGIGATGADAYEVDLDVFVDFVDALVKQYLSSSHPILRSLLEGFLATALVLVHRAGRTVPSLYAPTGLDPRDVSVGPEGIGALGSPGHLRDLADALARVMPR